MKAKAPKVSIVIPVYNGANFLKEAIDSALVQSYKNTEILVINDGSTDGGKTEAIALSYGNKIRYFYKENGGVASALNYGIKKMNGDYFSWLSHDDVYQTNKLEVQVDTLLTIQKPIILYSNFFYIDKNSNFFSKSGLDINKLKQLNSNTFKYELLKSHFANGCTFLIPKECFEIVGLFNEELKTSQDYDMWFRLAEHYDFYFISEELIKSRVHEKQGTYILNEFNVEKNNFYINCLNQISHEDLLIISKETSIEAAYLNLALFYRKENLTMAARYAWKLCQKAFFAFNNQNYIILNPLSIKNQINSIFNFIYNKKVIIFGTGRGAKLLINELNEKSICIEFCVDNDSTKWGTYFDNYIIKNPLSLLERNDNFVVLISSMYYFEIAEQLININFKENINFFAASNEKRVNVKNEH
ncbi:glycosyltransferase [Bacillus sp. CGMCC 1.16607]|uniref:glycosyltransferase n=1 Tax=Bacillus sp. CGMCC 1.16607 TaxID=3351842 RepID=UPI00362D13FC